MCEPVSRIPDCTNEEIHQDLNKSFDKSSEGDKGPIPRDYVCLLKLNSSLGVLLALTACSTKSTISTLAGGIFTPDPLLGRVFDTVEVLVQSASS